MEKANVEDRATTLIGSLSKGYKQRVGLADALVADPPLLILDEPTAGLDPNQIRDVRDVIKALGKEHTVLLSTHILSEVESTCTRILVIAKGKLVAQGKTPDIRKLRRSPGLEVRLAGDAETAQKILKGIEGVFKVKADPDGALTVLRATWSKKTDEAAVEKATEAAVRELAAAGLGIRSVQAVQSSLEEVFAELTRAPGSAKGPDDEEDAA